MKWISTRKLSFIHCTPFFTSQTLGFIKNYKKLGALNKYFSINNSTACFYCISNKSTLDYYSPAKLNNKI